jgi:hypothetical protein
MKKGLFYPHHKTILPAHLHPLRSLKSIYNGFDPDIHSFSKLAYVI